jgi:hypothetical protein
VAFQRDKALEAVAVSLAFLISATEVVQRSADGYSR